MRKVSKYKCYNDKTKINQKHCVMPEGDKKKLLYIEMYFFIFYENNNFLILFNFNHFFELIQEINF